MAIIEVADAGWDGNTDIRWRATIMMMLMMMVMMMMMIYDKVSSESK